MQPCLPPSSLISKYSFTTQPCPAPSCVAPHAGMAAWPTDLLAAGLPGLQALPLFGAHAFLGLQ